MRRTSQHRAGVADGVVVHLAHDRAQPRGALSAVVACRNCSQGDEAQRKVSSLGAAAVSVTDRSEGE